jgi:hypothetical protein
MNAVGQAWISECTVHGLVMLFEDDPEAAQKAWTKHLADHPDECCGLLGPGVHLDK